MAELTPSQKRDAAYAAELQAERDAEDAKVNNMSSEDFVNELKSQTLKKTAAGEANAAQADKPAATTKAQTAQERIKALLQVSNSGIGSVVRNLND